MLLRHLLSVVLALSIVLNGCSSKPSSQPETPSSADAGSAASKGHPSERRPPHAAAPATPQTGGGFDSYLLALSWAPQFCASHQDNRSASECDPAKHFGFVVHGLWPENNDGTYPSDCGMAQPVSGDIVRQMLPIMPARGLIQHEWAEHGTCSGLDSQDYFASVQKAFGNLKIPAEFQQLSRGMRISPGTIEQKFASANNAPADTFRTSCNAGKLIGVDVCLTKDLQYRSCGDAFRGCRAQQVTVLPMP